MEQNGPFGGIQGGDPDMLFALGRRYFNERSTAEEIALAIRSFRRGAERGHIPSVYALGECYLLGIGVERDEARAVCLLRRAAEKGDALAQCNLGVCYRNGLGVEKDEAQAVEWYRRLAKQGLAQAQCNLAYCYLTGIVVERNEARAVELFRAAAEQGSEVGQYDLGICYHNGRGVGQSYERAVEYLKLSASRNYAAAQLALGECYYSGQGVERDVARAAELYEAAARQGNATARCRLLDLAAQGLCTSAVWIDEAAEAGYLEAQIAREDRQAAERLGRERAQAAAEQRAGIANAPHRHHVFISWNHHDVAFKDRLVDGIEGYRGKGRIYPHFRTWESDRDGEGELEPCVREAIASSKCFIALLSEHSLRSAWMPKEIAWALERVDRGEWQAEDIIVVYLDDKVCGEIGRIGDGDDPFVRLSSLAGNFPFSSGEPRVLSNICGKIANCLARRTCERYLRETRRESAAYTCTLYGQISGEERRILKGRLSMERAYIPPRIYDEGTGRRVSPQEIAADPSSFWLSGEGGTGKSLFIRYLIGDPAGTGTIYLRLPLSEHASLGRMGDGEADSLETLLNAEICRYAEDDASRSDTAFARLREGRDGQIAVVLDGMDELDAAGRKRLLALVSDHRRRYPAERFIFLSRSKEGGTEFCLDGMKSYRLEGFTAGDAMRLYDAVSRENEGYLSILGAQRRAELRRGFERGLEQLSPSVKGDPLLLSELILIWLGTLGREALPTTKYEILRRAAEICLHSVSAAAERADPRIAPYLTGERAEELLQAVAYRLLREDGDTAEGLLLRILGREEDARALAVSLAAYLRRRRILCGGRLFHGTFTAYLAGEYLYRRIYAEREPSAGGRQIVFADSGTKRGENLGKRRLKEELCGGERPLFPETFADLIMKFDGEAHRCSPKRMDARHPCYPTLVRTLKIVRRRTGEVGAELKSATDSADALYYADLIARLLVIR